MASYPQGQAARWNGAWGSALAPISGEVRKRPTWCVCDTCRSEGLALASQSHQVEGLPVGLVVGLGAGAGCR